MESMRQEPDVRDAALPRPRDQFTEIAGVPRWTQEAETVEVGRRSVLPGCARDARNPLVVALSHRHLAHVASGVVVEASMPDPRMARLQVADRRFGAGLGPAGVQALALCVASSVRSRTDLRSIDR